MKPLPFVVLSLAWFSVWASSSGGAQQAATASSPIGVKIAEGEIKVVRDDGFATPGGPVTVERIPWDASFGTSAITVEIPATGFVIKVVEGEVAPVLVQEHPLEVYRISGMRFKSAEGDITMANRIKPSERRLQLILDGGEVYETWTLDFADPKKGLQIRYEDAGGW